MKRVLYVLAVSAMVGFSANAMAQSACGGTIVSNPDCNNARGDYTVSCCPDGYRVQGVAYSDIKGQDHVDAVSAVCRSISQGNDMMPSDFSGRNPVEFTCKKTEVFAGLSLKDVRVQGGDDRDTLDGATALCQTPNKSAIRRISNSDIDNNDRQGVDFSILLPKRVVGIAYKEISKGTSDRADCATIIVK